jgi:hypothetical protein
MKTITIVGIITGLLIMASVGLYFFVENRVADAATRGEDNGYTEGITERRKQETTEGFMAGETEATVQTRLPGSSAT